jgi:hypothetical protein
MRLLLRERDDGGYAQGVVLPVAAGCRPQVPSRGQPGRWPISGLLRWRPEGLPLVCAPLRFWSAENSKFLSNFTVNVRAIGLGHVRLVCCAVRVGLDRVGGATGDRLEGTCLRGRPVGTGQSLLTARTGWRYRLGFSDAPRLRRQRSRSRPLPSTRNLWRRVLRRRSSPSAADLRPWPVAGCRLALVGSLAIMCRHPHRLPMSVAGPWKRRCRQTLGLPSGVVWLPALSLKNL